ncbi:MAG: Uma2 family endonuclease, partial [Armatimonadota bacterium]|nr:Uma2 family endonuclease [Armatimonadota bacterium]
MKKELVFRLLCAADLAALPEDLPSGSVSYELHAGKLIVTPPTSDEHGSTESLITSSLVVNGQQAGLGKVRGGEVGILISRNPDTVLGADVVFLSTSQFPVEVTPEGYLATMPTLVVEIASKNDTQAKIKREVQQYLTAGVETVWVVYPLSKNVTVFQMGRDPTTFTGEERLIF